MNQVRKDVLNGWKEIAAYLGRDPRTVERWEKQRSLPVRRLPGSGRATVYALVSELDAWLDNPKAEAKPDVAKPVGAPALVTDTPNRGVGQVAESFEPAGATSAEMEHGGEPAAVNRGTRWLRWSVATGLLVLMGWLWGSEAFWKNRFSSANLPAKAVADPGSVVPSSPVPGVEDLYLRGAYQTELRTPDSLRRAQEAFGAALARDPYYAPAYAGMASTFVLLREYSVLPDATAYTRAVEAANKAVALDPTLPQAHAVLGYVDFFWKWDPGAAEREFQVALRLNPALSLSHHWYGSMLTHEARFQDGLRELNLAQKLEPSSPAILSLRAYALGLSGRRDEAVALLNDAVSAESQGLNRNPATMHSVLGNLNLLPPANVPRYLSEEMLVAQLREDAESLRTLHLGMEVYRAKGETAMWQALLEDERKTHGREPTFAKARYEAKLGDTAEALNDLDALCRQHDVALIGLSIDPLLAGLHRDPRFQHLRAEVGLPQAP